MPIKMERLDFWAYFLSFLIRVLSDRKKKLLFPQKFLGDFMNYAMSKFWTKSIPINFSAFIL
jgi:hypothetical protein